MLGRFAEALWALDPTDFPFAHGCVDDVDDLDQVHAAPNLTLTGLRLQAVG